MNDRNLAKGRIRQRTEVINDHRHMIDAIVRFINNSTSEYVACLSNYTFILTTDMEVLQAPKTSMPVLGLLSMFFSSLATLLSSEGSALIRQT